jgi:NAD(P)-dependent dehydrogenase (short-subunit alcohol dehydrogenase family)
MNIVEPTSRVAMVTGGGKRLGRQIVLALAQNGFDVAVNYHESRSGATQVVSRVKEFGQRGLALPGDISNRLSVERMVGRVLAAFGRIDLLVNNAGVFLDSPLQRTSDALWDATMDINLRGPFLCSQAVSTAMLKQKSGSIINIASLGGLQGWARHLPYSISKAGVIMLTRVLAKSLAPHITVNAIAPGTILMRGEEDPSVRHVPRKSILLKRYGTPSDITDMVVYLATKGRYITGQVIAIDGGRSIQ